MAFHPRRFWKHLHWATRLAMLAVFFAILCFQARYVWTIHNPMYGWPVPFNNVSHDGWNRDWLPWLLLDDAVVWLALVGAVGYTVEQWLQKLKRFQFTLGGVLKLTGAVAVVLGLGGAEAYLRAHPHNFTIFPKHARLDAHGVSVWFDIGLFTDPFGRWPLIRLAIMFAIGCFVYTTISLLVLVIMRVCGAAPIIPPQENTEVPRRDPPLIRLLLIGLAIVTFFFGFATLSPPAIR